jgi:hypothetical protein
MLYYICCFCKKKYQGYGNNPQPVKKKGRCCNRCNLDIIIPARVTIAFGKGRIGKKNDN